MFSGVCSMFRRVRSVEKGGRLQIQNPESRVQFPSKSKIGEGIDLEKLTSAASLEVCLNDPFPATNHFSRVLRNSLCSFIFFGLSLNF